MTGAQDFPEAAHAKVCSARKGEGQQRKLQPDEIGRREENGLLLLLPLALPPGSSERLPSAPSPPFAPAWLRALCRGSRTRPARQCAGLGEAPPWGTAKREASRPAARGQRWSLCAQHRWGLGAASFGVLDLSAQGGRRTLPAKGPHPRGLFVCKKVKIN